MISPNNEFKPIRLCHESCFSGIRRARFVPFNGSQVKQMLDGRSGQDGKILDFCYRV